ncbi:hypothetical protein L6164_020863 [Bauhinia variegata]|uniref:Uncharacterized protein n=1 Tax=Bauhinia variegata TaxID=167791 RepID=A0ACB9MWR6_BAUVA|nr:hypothetical protein L6164_020863 [Bauhinia variegata]
MEESPFSAALKRSRSFTTSCSVFGASSTSMFTARSKCMLTLTHKKILTPQLPLALRSVSAPRSKLFGKICCGLYKWSEIQWPNPNPRKLEILPRRGSALQFSSLPKLQSELHTDQSQFGNNAGSSSNDHVFHFCKSLRIIACLRSACCGKTGSEGERKTIFVYQSLPFLSPLSGFQQFLIDSEISWIQIQLPSLKENRVQFHGKVIL